MQSPCIRQCKLKDNICLGCKRSLEEIQNWMFYSDSERLQILEKLKNE